MYNIYALWPTADIEALNENGDVVGGGGIWFYNDLSFSGIDAVLNDVNDGDIAVGMGIGVDNGRPIMVSNGVITDLSYVKWRRQGARSVRD